jgi:AraC-like DNA-binding protein
MQSGRAGLRPILLTAPPDDAAAGALLPGPSSGAAFGRRLSTDEPDDFAGALAGARCECLRFPGAPFAATLRLLRLGDMLVQHVRIGAHISRTVLGPGMAMVLLPLHQPSATPHINGAPVRTGEALVVRGGVEFHCHSPAPHEWAAIAVPPDLLDGWVSEGLLGAAGAGGIGVVALPLGPARRLGGALSAMARLPDKPPEAWPDPAAIGPLACSVRDLLAETLTGTIEPRPQPRATREAQRVVLRAEELLRTRPDAPVHLDELCAAVAVSQRKLRDAFTATVGIGPHGYLKLRRLTQARRWLLHGQETALVKAAALSHGFWHAGHFAEDYRRLFGEAPSDTARRARDEGTGTPPPAGRWRDA